MSTGKLERIETEQAELRLHGSETALLQLERWRLDAQPSLALWRSLPPEGCRRPPVVLVHGFAQNRFSWHTRLRSFSGWLAARGWDVWNLELRGHGESRGEGQLGAEDFDDYVLDVMAAARAIQMDFGSPFLIGHSLGGAAVYAASARLAAEGHPPRGVIGLAGIYGFGQGNPWIGTLCRLTHSISSSSIFSKVQVRSRLLGKALGQLYGITDVLGYTFPISGWWPGSVEPELLAERLEHGFDWTSVRVWQEMSRWAATGRFDGRDVDYDDLWRGSEVPVLVVLGDKDHLLPPTDGRVAYERTGAADKELIELDPWSTGHHWGHLDIVLGQAAPRWVWSPVESWMAAR